MEIKEENKITWVELADKMRAAVKKKDGVEIGVVVFKEENWPDKDYSLDARSYMVSSDAKYFDCDMCGSSIFSSSLDGEDRCMRLDYMLFGDHAWKIDYCYIVSKEEIRLAQEEAHKSAGKVINARRIR